MTAKHRGQPHPLYGEAQDAAMTQMEMWAAHKGGDHTLDFPRLAHNADLLRDARIRAAAIAGGPPEGVGFSANGSTFLMQLANFLARIIHQLEPICKRGKTPGTQLQHLTGRGTQPPILRGFSRK